LFPPGARKEETSVKIGATFAAPTSSPAVLNHVRPFLVKTNLARHATDVV